MGDAFTDPVREWTFRRKAPDGAEEERHYTQQELTIDGELQLFAIANRSVSALSDAEFPFHRLGELFRAESVSKVGDVDWALASEMLSHAAGAAPLMVAEVAATMLGQHATDGRGRRDPAFDEEVAFLRQAMHLSDFVDMVETFVAQNEVERLRRPLARAWRAFLERGAGAEAALLSLGSSTSSPATATAPPASSAATTRGGRSTRT
jgi:hypothetical protein